jgi:hypothetical protein
MQINNVMIPQTSFFFKYFLKIQVQKSQKGKMFIVKMNKNAKMNNFAVKSVDIRAD